MTANQFGILMAEIKGLREQVSRIEERLREVEIIQASDEVARKVREDLSTKSQIGVRWKLSVLVSIAGTAITIALKLLEGVS
jgi:hypothetical protein